jgi:N-acetylmuramoyl-L-alanine amidase
MRVKTFNLIVTLGFLSFWAGRASGGLTGKVIGLDPGHGEGHNPGVCIAEGTWVLDAGFRTRLEGRGATVVMTRTTGANPDHPTRYDILNSNNCHLAVSLHSNAAGPAVQGVEHLLEFL